MQTTINASALAYWQGGGSSVSGQARQGMAGGQNYTGQIAFDLSSIGNLTNIDISAITLAFHVGEQGGGYDKYLYLKHTGRTGTAVGNYKFSACRNANKSISFSASSNAGGFNALKAYIEGISGGSTVILGVNNTVGSRGSGSGKSYDYDYMNITSASLTLTYTYKKSTGSIGAASTGSAATLRITAYNSGYSHRVTWKLGDNTQIQTIAAGTASASYTIPHSWLPNATSGSATVTLETLNGSTSLGSNTYRFMVSVPPDVVPGIGGLTTTPVNSGASATAFGWGLYIQNRTKCTAAMTNVSAGTGATIKSYSITTSPNFGSGTSSSLTTNLLTASGTVTITAKVTDSRGRTATLTASITVRAYAPPQFTATPTVYRCLSNGDRDDIEGRYALLAASFSYSSVNGNNSLTVRRVELNGVNTNLTSGQAEIIGAGALALDDSYTAIVRLTDAVGSETVFTLTIPSARYVIHIARYGQAIGIGRAAGDLGNRMYVAWIIDSDAAIMSGVDFRKLASGVDISRANNNVSEDTYPIGYRVMDGEDRSIGFMSGAAYADGRTGIYFQAQNYNTAGQSVGAGRLGVRVAKDGSVDYMVSDAAAFRQSIGLGNASGALPVANGGTGATTADAGLAALSAPRVNVSWKDSPIGISHYFYESTTAASDYDLPHNYVEVLVLKRSATRGIALAYRWANKTGGFWKNNLTDTWQGWVGNNDYYKAGEEPLGTWVDGKLLYRYTCSGSTTSTGDITTSHTLPRTPDSVIRISGAFHSGADSAWRPIPFATYYNINQSFSGVVTGDSKVHLYIGSGLTGTKTWKLVIEYTA